MVTELIEEQKATFADQVYERFKNKTYSIEGFFNENLIFELSIELEAAELELDLKTCK